MKTKISTAKDAIAESTGGNYLNKSGVYDIEINFVSVAVADSGAESVNFNVTYDGNVKTLWGPTVTNKNGDDNEIGYALINKLGVIAGMDDSDELELEEETHAVGLPAKDMDFTVITNFSEMPVQVQVQEEYSRYNGNITEKLAIRAFFRAEDGATADEIVNETEAGKQLAQVMEKYADKVSYRDSSKGAGDAPTPEEVAEWKAAKAAARGGNAATTGKVNAAAKTRKTFGKK